MPVLVGTSGWHYRDWRGRFYEGDLPVDQWLRAYAKRFPIVEINNTFYRLPPAKTFEGWASTTAGSGLRFVIKASRYLTHVKRLSTPTEPVHRLVERARPLGPRLDAVLLQLPPGFAKDLRRLSATLDAFAQHGVRVAFEPRHLSWLDEDVLDELRQHDCALCWTDRASRPSPAIRTASWGYVRLHGGSSRTTAYGPQALRTWAGRVQSEFDPNEDVYVFFNNDHGAAAPRNAESLQEMLPAASSPAASG